MKQEKCHGRPPAGSTDHPFWGPYRRFVKGEMARSALEKASYMDIVYGCPLDAMHFLYGGIWKKFWSCVLMDAKYETYMSVAAVEDMFHHFRTRLKVPSRWRRGIRFTMSNYSKLKMAEFMIPSNLFPMSTIICTSPYYKSHVACMIVLTRYLILPKWQREGLTKDDKEIVKKINEVFDMSLRDLHGYGSSAYSINHHHFSHAYILAEMYDGNFSKYTAEGPESSYGFCTRSNMNKYFGHASARIPLRVKTPFMIEDHPCDVHLRISPKQHSKFDDSYVYTRGRKFYKVVEDVEDTHNVFKVQKVQVEEFDLEIDSKKFGMLSLNISRCSGVYKFIGLTSVVEFLPRTAIESNACLDHSPNDGESFLVMVPRESLRCN